jgi:cobalt-zinc-cadmium efflux system outer membrane protein
MDVQWHKVTIGQSIKQGVAWLAFVTPIFFGGRSTPLGTRKSEAVVAPNQRNPATAIVDSSPCNVIQVAHQASGAPAAATTDDSKGAENDNVEKIALPQAIQMSISQNFRLLAGAEKVRQAEADVISAGLIPNPTVFAGYQLIPLQEADIKNQLGPPQADVLVSIPIDWLLFGKRVAQLEAARLGIDVSAADHADLMRVQVGRAVDAFYEVLTDEYQLKLADANLEELQQIERMTVALEKEKKVGKSEVNLAQLAAHEALLARHDRELEMLQAKARLRPLLGRTAADPLFEVVGNLGVSAVVPPPTLAEAVALAEAHRPDLMSDRHEIARSQATVTHERRKALPQMSIVPGWSYQNQQNITGFRNGSMFDIGLSSSLPITDRNQGAICKAQSRERELCRTYLANRADALAEVEASVATYDDAVEHLTLFNTPGTIAAAHELRASMEAGYRDGERKLQEYLLAHRAYRDRLAHVVEFESTYWRALNRLNTAVGLNAYDQDTRATKRIQYDEAPRK